MESPVKVAIIGLDTAHTLEFARLMCGDDSSTLNELQLTSCLRLETPSRRQSVDDRQAELESLGVKVTESFDEAVADCEAVMLEIDDPAQHLEYFRRALPLGKPIFVDKALAGTLAEAIEIRDIARSHNARVMSCSCGRFNRAFEAALAQVSQPEMSDFFGLMNTAPTGDPLVWYGVHTFEMLQRAMGAGAQRVTATGTARGYVSVVEYVDGRQAVVDLNRSCKFFGGRLQTSEYVRSYVVAWSSFYVDLLRQVARFCAGEQVEVSLDDAVEVMALIDATRRSLDSGRSVRL